MRRLQRRSCDLRLWDGLRACSGWHCLVLGLFWRVWCGDWGDLGELTTYTLRDICMLGILLFLLRICGGYALLFKG